MHVVDFCVCMSIGTDTFCNVLDRYVDFWILFLSSFQGFAPRVNLTICVFVFFHSMTLCFLVCFHILDAK